MSDDAKLDDFVESQPEEENSVKDKKKIEVEIPPKTVELPSHWELMELQKVGDLNPSNVDKKSRESETPVELCNYMDVYNNECITNELDFMKATASEREMERFLLDEGDVIFTKDSEEKFDIAVPAVVRDQLDNVLCGYHLFLIKPDNEIVHSAYLSKSLQHYPVSSHLGSRANGTTRFGLTVSSTERAKVPIPPLPEQRKIATVLHTVDQAIQKTEQIVEQAHMLKKSLMQDIFHGYHKDFTYYHTTPVGEIPIDWSVASIGDVVHTAQYGISESMSEEGQYPIFRMNNIENGYMIDEPLKYIDLDDDEFEKYRVEEGDILFNRTNSLKLVGKTGIYQLDGDHVFASYLVRLQTNDRAEPYYLNYYMNSSEAQNRMMDFATKGVSQANINANSIQQVKIPLPPIEEQKEIVGHIRSIDSQIESNKHYLSQLKQTKNGLMQDLLSGEVRTTDVNIDVPQEVAQHG